MRFCGAKAVSAYRKPQVLWLVYLLSLSVRTTSMIQTPMTKAAAGRIKNEKQATARPQQHISENQDLIFCNRYSPRGLCKSILCLCSSKNW